MPPFELRKFQYLLIESRRAVPTGTPRCSRGNIEQRLPRHTGARAPAKKHPFARTACYLVVAMTGLIPPPGDVTQETRTVRRRNQYTHARRPGRVKLRVLDGPAAGTEVVIEKNRLRVGRSKSASVQIDHESLSGLHFELRLGRTGVEVMDLNSKNGTFLLGRRIYQAAVHPGDEIVAGTCRIVLVETSDVTVEHGAELRDDGLLGISEPILEAFGVLGKIAPTNLPVLLTGKTGVGKDLFAKAIHRHSPRSDRKFIVLDCAALADGLADSVLFGQKRGAYPHADRDRAGVFEQADGGTLLIDEVGELSLSTQAKLLRVLETMEVTRLGDSGSRKVDVRVLATTHRDLPTMIDGDRFREDLYFRLASVPLHVPGLRTRGGDEIEYLASQFLAVANRRAGTSLTMGKDAYVLLRGYGWPGNVRELKSVIDRLPALCGGTEIHAGDLALSDYRPRSTRFDEIVRTGTLKDIHMQLDRWLLPQALKDTGGNISEAARRLDVGRKALTNRLIELGLRDK